MIARNACLLASALAVACGREPRVGPDARPLDAAPDVPTSTGDPPPTAVALTVTSLGAPVGNVPVYFQNANSSIAMVAQTDARGVAWATLGDGGFVTVIEPGSGATAISTFAAVQASDRLHLDLQPVPSGALVTVTLTVPAAATAASYDLYNPCGDTVTLGASPTGMASFVDCGHGLIDLVIVPRDVDGVAAFGALYAANVAISDGGTVQPSGTYAPLTPTTFTYLNVPSSVAWLNTYQAVLSPRGRVFEAGTGVTPVGATATDGLSQVPGVPTVLTVSDSYPTSAELGEQLAYEWGPYAAAYTLDLASKRLPAYTSAPTYVAATHTISWDEGAGGAPANFARAKLSAYRDAVPGGRAWTWRIAAPHDGTSVTFPQLPDLGFDFNPAATDAVGIADLTTALVPGGYAAVRANAFAELTRIITATAPGVMLVQLPYSPPL